MVDRTRRRALLAAGTVSIAAVAGCTSLLGPNCRPREAPQWKIDGERWSRPIQQDNRLLVSENYGATGDGMLSRIVCIADYDGQEQWIYTVQDGGAGIPSVHDGTVYVGTGTDLVYALDFETGHRRWQYDAGGQEEYGGGAWGAPAVIDDRVIVGVSHSERPDPDPTNSDAYIHRVVALDTSDGAEQWTLPVEGMVWAGPVHIDDSVVVVTRTGRILRVNPRTGKRLWRAKLGDEIRVQPIVGDGAVFIASQNGRAARFDLEESEPAWQVSVPGPIEAVAATDDLLLVGDGTDAVTALARADGARSWRYETGAAVADVAVETGVAWILNQRGVLHRVDAATGSVSRRVRVAENHYEEQCGWNPEFERGTGLALDEETVYVTGPWIGSISTDEE